MGPRLAVLVASIALALPLGTQDVPSGAYGSLDAAALALAKAGRVDEAKRVAAILEELAYPAAMRDKLAAAIARESSKAKQAADAVPDAAKKLESAAKQLVPLLAGREGDARTALARAILELDSESEEARAALGHAKVGNAWGTPEERATLERRLEIERVRQECARLEVEIEQAESQDELLTKILGRPGVVVRRGGHVVHSAFDAEKTARILRETERALAFSAYLRRGEVQLTPAKSGPIAQRVTILFDTRAHYLEAVDLWEEEGKLTAERAAQGRELASMFDGKSRTIYAPRIESQLASGLLASYTSLADGTQSAIKAGHLNWVSMSLLGTPLPTFEIQQSSGGAFHRGGTGVAESGAAKKEREERAKLAGAGVRGCRAWMAWLAERGEDPRFEEALEDQVGKVRGEVLLKATSVVEFLQETGRFPALVKATEKAGASPRAVYEAGLKLSMAELEAEWRRWILPRARGLAQRVGKRVADVPTDEEKDVLAALNGARAKAFEGVFKDAPEVGIERSLSEGAELHARYLVLNPDDSREWPDALGEISGREGFTPEGAIAGAASSVAFGVGTPEDAIERWLGTFYQRLPLLDPGLVRIGVGWDADIVVMDVTSLWTPPTGTWTVVWPPDGMKSVPLGFQGEQPSPVPGADPATLGYPITLQLGLPEGGAPPPSIEMKLLLDGREVPCHASTPDVPSNVELAPRNAFALIPKAPLEAGRTYTAVATWRNVTGKQLTWTFRT